MPRPKKLGSKGQRKVATVMREYTAGKLHSGSKRGPVVHSRKQALAIGYAEARRRRGHGKK